MTYDARGNVTMASGDSLEQSISVDFEIQVHVVDWKVEGALSRFPNTKNRSENGGANRSAVGALHLYPADSKRCCISSAPL